MGFLDFLFDKELAEKKKIAKLQKSVVNMYVQPQERKFIMQQLREIGSDDAVRVLISRFNESSPNSTVDLEEKQWVYDVLVDMSRQTPGVQKIVEEHVHKADSHINWPIKVLSDLFTYQEMANYLRELLEPLTTDCVRDPEKKQEVILHAAEFKTEELAQEVARFLEDANETVRFLAVDTLITLGFPLATEPMVRCAIHEESNRVIQKIAAGLAEHNDWIVAPAEREALAKVLPADYTLHNDGYVVARRN